MGQDQSFPMLPKGQDDIKIEDAEGPCIPFIVNASHRVKTITVTNTPVTSFPLQCFRLRSIVLRSCSLGTIIDDFKDAVFDFPELEKLDLKKNELTAMPESINRFKKLKILNLSRNKLRGTLHFELPCLEQLNLFLNKLTCIPEGLPETLTKLKIGYNKVMDIELQHPRLEYLNVAGNSLFTIDPASRLPSLVTLDCSYNALDILDNLRDIAPKLTTLICSFNKLTHFPACLPLTIEKVTAVFNDMIEFTEPIYKYKSLVNVDVRKNLLTQYPRLPPKIAHFRTSDNRFREVDVISARHLKTLDLGGGNLTEIPDCRQSDVLILRLNNNKIEHANLKALNLKLMKINLSRNLLKSIDSRLFKMSQMQVVILVNNQISSLPDALSSSSVRELFIGGNPIAELPKLPKSLVILSACRCRFEKIPESLKRCSNLKIVDFSANRLKTVEFIPNSAELMLSLNEIEQLPPSFPSAVKTIDISHNKLTSFNVCLQFSNVDVSHNRITSLQLAQKEYKYLTFLNLAHNENLGTRIDFAKMPKLSRVDLCGTKVTHNIPVPPGLALVEIVSPNRELFEIDKDNIFKFFSSDVGYSEAIGRRKAFEDSLIISTAREENEWSLYGVLDGHGGQRASVLSALMIPRLAKSDLVEIDDIVPLLKHLHGMLMSKEVEGGATLALAMIKGNELGVAHLGDARILLVRKDGSVEQLTIDHKANERKEIEYVKECGSFLKDGRLEKSLAITRSLGDFRINEWFRDPEVNRMQIPEDAYRLVIGCDGVFDVLTNEEIAGLVHEWPDIFKAATLLRNVALSSGSEDNVSVVVVDLENRH